jgi:hypothetical protein
MSNLNPDQFHPHVQQYISGGIGHLDDDPTRSVVGMVPVERLLPYREHGGIQNPHALGRDQGVIDAIARDLRRGLGLREPLVMDYDSRARWGFLGEGNHRLAAARQAGVPYVPVRVYGRSYGGGERKEKGVGAPLEHDPAAGGYAGPGYVAPAIHPYHFPRLRP